MPSAALAEPERRVERVVAVVRERDRAVPAAALLRLVAVGVVEAGLEGMPARDFRQADGDVLGPVDVEEPGKGMFGGPYCGCRLTRPPHVNPGGIWIRVPSQIGGLTSLRTPYA